MAVDSELNEEEVGRVMNAAKTVGEEKDEKYMRWVVCMMWEAHGRA